MTPPTGWCLNDNGSTNIGSYFAAGGAGADLTISIQTSAGVDSQTVADAYASGAAAAARFDVDAAMAARIEGIATGELFILALWRDTPAALLAGGVVGGAGALTRQPRGSDNRRGGARWRPDGRRRGAHRRPGIPGRGSQVNLRR